MKAELTASQLFWNTSLLEFFFRQQAIENLEEFIFSQDDRERAIAAIDGVCEDYDISVDALEEIFYEYQMAELYDLFGKN